MSFRDFTPRSSRDKGPEFRTTSQQLKKNELRRATSGSNIERNGMSAAPTTHHGSRTMPQRNDNIEFCRSRSESDYAIVESMMVQKREDKYALQVMQQREEELSDTHRKMHVVNEIYKELGEVVVRQGVQIDEIEKQFDGAAEDTRRGLKQIQNANTRHTKRKEEESHSEGRGGDDPDTKAKKFFLHHYFSKATKEIFKVLSICGGSGSMNFVDDRCCKP